MYFGSQTETRSIRVQYTWSGTQQLQYTCQVRCKYSVHGIHLDLLRKWTQSNLNLLGKDIFETLPKLW